MPSLGPYVNKVLAGDVTGALRIIDGTATGLGFFVQDGTAAGLGIRVDVVTTPQQGGIYVRFN